MNIKDLKASLPYLFKAQITPFIWGHAGIGKTSVVKQLAKDLNYKFFAFYLGTQSDVGDILGLQTFVKDEFEQDVATKFAVPKWIKETIDYCKANPKSGAIIFLDEFNRANRDILNSIFSLALDKTFHEMKLPDNCYLIAAGNPSTDEYYVTDTNETALMGRFAHIKLEPLHEEWLSYAREKEFDPTIISFLQEQPGMLSDTRQAFTLPIKVDGRAWERYWNIKKTDIPDNLLSQLAIGIVGAERLVAYEQHVKSTCKPLTAKEVLSGQKKDLVKSWSSSNEVQSSYINASIDNVIVYLNKLSDEYGKDMKKSEKDELLAFILALPLEHAFAFINSLTFGACKFDKTKFLTHPDYMKSMIPIVEASKGVS